MRRALFLATTGILVALAVLLWPRNTVTSDSNGCAPASNPLGVQLGERVSVYDIMELYRPGDAASGRLERGINGGNDRVAIVCLVAMTRIDVSRITKKYVPLLERGLEFDERHIRAACAGQLGRLRSRESVPQLLTVIRRQSPEPSSKREQDEAKMGQLLWGKPRITALQAVSDIGHVDSDVIDAILVALNATDDFVLTAAARALQVLEIKDPRVLRKLRQIADLRRTGRVARWMERTLSYLSD